MKIGVFTTLLSNLSLEEALKYFTSLGIEMVEIGCGGYPGNAHANPDILLNDDKALDTFNGLIKEYGVGISALSCHGNAIHPDKAIASAFDSDFRKAVLLAEKLGISRQTLADRLDGTAKWKWEEMLRLAEVLGCTLNELAGVEGGEQ